MQHEEHNPHTKCTSLSLVTESVNDLWGGSDECYTGLLNLTRKYSIFG